MFFNDLGLGEKTLKGISDVGYTHPTPIQEQVIPYILHRRDIFGCAQTGTGKTGSFTLPLLDILEKGRMRARMPRVLILAPTRELAHQVAESFSTYGKYHKFKFALLIGGESIYEQERKLAQGADILIGTPGRFLDLFDRSRLILNALEAVVIDEADRMLDMGFIPDIERIFSLIPDNRQTLMFSATVSQEVRRLCHTFLKDFVEISAGTPSKAAETVKHYVVHVAAKAKRDVLRHLIQTKSVKNAIIFCNRKKDISILCDSLKKYGYNAAPLHGDLHQSHRSETLSLFKSGNINFLVASDVAARGIDVAELDFVFNFDAPTSAEEYVHRIGRTGRAGRSGEAFMFVTKTETKYLKAIEKLLNIEIPEYPLTRFAGQEQNLKKSSQQEKDVPKDGMLKAKKNLRGGPRRLTAPPPFPSTPVVGFGEWKPAFMNHYFPHLGSASALDKQESVPEEPKRHRSPKQLPPKEENPDDKNQDHDIEKDPV